MLWAFAGSLDMSWISTSWGSMLTCDELFVHRDTIELSWVIQQRQGIDIILWILQNIHYTLNWSMYHGWARVFFIPGLNCTIQELGTKLENSPRITSNFSRGTVNWNPSRNCSVIPLISDLSIYATRPHNNTTHIEYIQALEGWIQKSIPRVF